MAAAAAVKSATSVVKSATLLGTVTKVEVMARIKAAMAEVTVEVVAAAVRPAIPVAVCDPTSSQMLSY